MTLVTKSSLRINPVYTKTADLIASGLTAAPSVSDTFDLTDGTAAGMGDLIYFDQASLSGTTPLNLDLAPYTDIFGVSKTLVKVKLIYLKAAVANTQTIIVGNGTAPFVGPFGAAGASEHYLRAGAVYFAFDPVGWGVTATTADIFKFLGGGAGTHIIDILIIGTSA